MCNLIGLSPYVFLSLTVSTHECLQSDIHIDDGFLPEIRSFHKNSVQLVWNVRRIFHAQKDRGLAEAVFDVQDIARLLSPCARLNDVCINGGAALLYSFFSSPVHPTSQVSQRCALLSTFDLPRVRHNISDNELWRHLSHTMYWTRDVWIIPIHQPAPDEHWVLCVASVPLRRLFLFDSLAEEKPWIHEMKVSYTFCMRTMSASQNIDEGHNDLDYTDDLTCK